MHIFLSYLIKIFFVMGTTNCCKKRELLENSSLMFEKSLKCEQSEEHNRGTPFSPAETCEVNNQDSVPQNENIKEGVKDFQVETGFVGTNKGAIKCEIREYMQNAVYEKELRNLDSVVKSEPEENFQFVSPPIKMRSNSGLDSRSRMNKNRCATTVKKNHRGKTQINFPKLKYTDVKSKYMVGIFPENNKCGEYVNFTASIPNSNLMQNFNNIKTPDFSGERSTERHKVEEREINIIFNKNLMNKKTKETHAWLGYNRRSLCHKEEKGSNLSTTRHKKSETLAGGSSTLSLSNSLLRMKQQQQRDSPEKLSLKLKELMEKATIES